MHALSDYVVIEPIQDVQKESVIILEKENPTQTKGKVLSVGPEVKELKNGAIVLLPRYGEQCEIEGKKYAVVHEKEIAVLFK